MKPFFKSLLTFVESRKFYVAVIGFVLQLVALYINPLPEWYSPLVALLTAAGVYVTPNATVKEV